MPIRIQSSDLSVRARTPSLILVVEDDPVLGQIVEETLEALGYNVIRAMNADEALHILGRTQVDLMFTDVIMPGMNGVDLAARVREDIPGLPILLVTGLAPEAALLKSQEFPMLQKPYRMAELKRMFVELGVGP